MIEKFERKEAKYLINLEQFNIIKKEVVKYLDEDKYYKSSVRNIYYDTPSYLLIRKSIEKPVYKEKLRIRSYGINSKDDIVFLELKKKYKGVVYKRRVELTYSDALLVLSGIDINNDQQVIKEIKQFIKFYQDIGPKLYLSYDRYSYKSKDKSIRITFDYNILYRLDNLDLCSTNYGDKILDDNMFVMEVKTMYGYPKWLVDILSQNKIYKTSFSKYGNAYKQIMNKRIEDKIIC